MLTPSEYWDREATAPHTPTHLGWMAHPLVRRYINRNITGREEGWPLDWFQATYPAKFLNALSIGCGTGKLERDLLQRGIAGNVAACDASPQSLRIARETAAAEGLRIDYFAADFNRLELKRGHYDLICFHQSLHHVERLEHLLGQVRRALKPGGLLYLDEFVGPSRTYWTRETMRWYSALYQLFPREVRHFEELALPIQEEDPSEAIRSGDILTCLRIGFDIEHFRGYGGNVLAVLFPAMKVDKLSDDEVEALIRCEQGLMWGGDPSFHAVITLRPKGGAMPRVRYAVEPRLPALFRELRFLKKRYF